MSMVNVIIYLSNLFLLSYRIEHCFTDQKVKRERSTYVILNSDPADTEACASFYTQSGKIIADLNLEPGELVAQLRRKQRTNPFLRELKSSWLDFQTQASSFKDDLYAQLHTLNQPYRETICQILIESLNDRGFLDEPLDELAQAFHQPLSDWEEQLRLLQQLEPAGIAAAPLKNV